MAHSLSTTTSSATESVCHTEQCVKTGKSILDFVDLNVDPCSDFYQYTCGSWLKNSTIPDDKSSVGTFDKVRDDNTETLRNILEGGYQDVYTNLKDGVEGFHTEDEKKIDEANFETMKKYYDVCMDTSKIDQLGPTPIFSDISKIENDLFPVRDAKVFDSSERWKQQLTEILVYQGHRGIDSLFSVDVEVDDKHPDKNVIVLDQANLGLPSKEYYEKPETLETYKKDLAEVLATVLGECEGCNDPRSEVSKKNHLALWSKEKIQNAVQNYVDFETQLAKISLKSEELQDPVKNYNSISTESLSQKWPKSTDWVRFLTSMMAPNTPLPENVIVKTPTFFDGLDKLFSNGVQMQTLQEYFVIKYVNNFIYTLDTASRTAYRKLNGDIVTGTTVEQPRWRICTDYTSNLFGESLGRYYTLRSFGSEKERMKTEVFLDTIHEAWRNKLPDADWLDAETKKKAIEKLNLIKHKVAYSLVSPDVRSPSSLAKYFDGLKVVDRSFFGTELSGSMWATAKAWKKLGEKVDKDEWYMTPQTVNAYYSPNSNEIAIPAGILQPPFFDTEFPEFLNYGGIGAVIGHELSHAFDNSGRKYDGHGYLVDWWTNTTSQEFDKKTTCFIDQYSKFNITGPDGKVVNVKGKQTLGENLADNGGISAALLAYKKLRPNSNTPEQRLPGLEKLSIEQLFFINFGRIWCRLERPKAALQHLLTDEHSPSVARVNGVAQNSIDFAKAFNCPSGSNMNPEKKCVIW
ncbi:zincin [Backusella circina FSU 941]|nr:zincin [Backusella circina FSU 941]